MEKGGRQGQVTGLARDVACGTRRATVMHGTRACDVGAHPIWTETAVHCTKTAGGRRFRRHSVRWASVGCAYASRPGANACDGADRAGVVVRQSSGQCGAGREAVMRIQVLAFRGRFAIGCRLLGRMWARAVAPDSRLLTVVIAGTQQQS